jgi:predicted Fe-Mo cluster-binding NifX family protein
MRVAVSAAGRSLDAALDPRFGRCAHFVFVDTDTMATEAIENGAQDLEGGAGIQAARLVVEKGATIVLTGDCGPNAHRTLTAAGVEVFAGCSGTVSDVVERFKAGRLAVATGPTVASHAGTSGSPR